VTRCFRPGTLGDVGPSVLPRRLRRLAYDEAASP
jgi:hypothetical protein